MKIKETEVDLQKQICEWLNYNHCFVWRNNSGLILLENKQGKRRAFRAGIKGMADIIGIKSGGQFLAIEVKIGRNKPTNDQIDFLEKIREMGGEAFVVYSLEDVIARLK